MRSLALLCAVSFAVFAGCDGAPVEPLADELAGPSFSVVHDAWVDAFVLDGFFDYVACANDGAGEEILWAGTIDAYYRSRTTPSGNVIIKWKLDYDTATPAGFTGQDSKDVWQVVRAEDTGGLVSKPKGTEYVEHWQLNEFYVNQDGEKIHNRAQFRMMVDADGDVKMDRFNAAYKCPGKPLKNS